VIVEWDLRISKEIRHRQTWFTGDLMRHALLDRGSRTVDLSVSDAGSRSTPLRDITGSANLRLKQQAARRPDLSFKRSSLSGSRVYQGFP
jgi:hypothetical protein